MKDFASRLEAAKRASTLHLLFKCSRLLNERAIASLPRALGEGAPRAAHLALFPHIELEGGTRLTELAEHLGISKQAVGQLVDELETMGILRREPDPLDGRAKRVVFTSAGRRSMLDGLNHLRAVETELVAEIGAEVVQPLRRALLELHDHLLGDA